MRGEHLPLRHPLALELTSFRRRQPRQFPLCLIFSVPNLAHALRLSSPRPGRVMYFLTADDTNAASNLQVPLLRLLQRINQIGPSEVAARV